MPVAFMPEQRSESHRNSGRNPTGTAVGIPPEQRSLSRRNDGRIRPESADIFFKIKYQLFESKEKPVTVVTGLDIKPYSADSHKAGTGTNDIAPYIAVSTIVNEKLRPYAYYRAVIRDHGAADLHIIAAGVEGEINKTVTLQPSFSATFRTSSDLIKPYETYAFGLSSYLQIVSKLYLIPNFSAGVSTSTRSKNGVLDYGSLTFYDMGLGLYYLFN